MAEQTHSPLPWALYDERSATESHSIEDANGDVVVRAKGYVTDADAAFIVRAVNSHYELLEALKKLTASWVWDDYRASFSIAALLEDAQKAIAKAEGREATHAS